MGIKTRFGVAPNGKYLLTVWEATPDKRLLFKLNIPCYCETEAEWIAAHLKQKNLELFS